MTRQERIIGLHDWICKHVEMSKEWIIVSAMRDFQVTRQTAEGYLDSVLAGIPGKPKLVNQYGIIRVADG